MSVTCYDIIFYPVFSIDGVGTMFVYKEVNMLATLSRGDVDSRQCTHTHTHKCMHAHTHMCTHTHARTRTHAHTKSIIIFLQ